MNDLAHIPAPSEATWVDDWCSFEIGCGQQYWLRHFRGRTWTVEACSTDAVEVDLAGNQFSDGSVEMWVCLEGAVELEADEALMLAATLSRAAEELERIQGGSQ